MSFQAPPPPSIFATPGINDDATRGIYVGMTVVDTTASPPVVYVCTSNNIGAAKWSPVGTLIRANNVVLGSASTLNFERATASVHNGVATITPFGGWQNYAAFSATAGQTFFPLVGVSVAPQSHQVFANGILLRLGAQYDYSIDVTGITLASGVVMSAGDPLVVYY
jgi:hypothetical protein